MDDRLKTPLPSWLPFVAGAILVLQFAGLGIWQIDRGLGKLDARRDYDHAGGFSNFYDGAEVRPYQPLKASGRYVADRQFLLDNIIVNGRVGYYVLTPLEMGENEPLLMVNRGWFEKNGVRPEIATIAGRIGVDGDRGTTVRGRVGSLPRAGMRMGEAIEAGVGWPTIAVYPANDDIEAALGRPIQPFVLLMDPGDENGFLRQWVPSEMGPGKHFAYAFQWFAMGAVLSGLLVWHYRKRTRSGE